MNAQTYYRVLADNNGNVAVQDRYLAVNCTGCCVLPNPFTTNIPAGRKDYYLQYLCMGAMRVWIDGESRIMRPGELIVYYPDTGYHYSMEGNDEILYYWVHFSGYGAGELLQDCGIANKKTIYIGVSEAIVREITGLFREFIIRDTCFEKACTAKLTSVFVSISRTIEAEKSRSLRNGSIFTSLEFIHKNFCAEISVEQLAMLEHLSVSRYRTLFKRSTGYSPLDYIIMLRIKRACELIVQTDWTLREISEAVGYIDPLYFSRIFKARTGVIPSVFRLNSQQPGKE